MKKICLALLGFISFTTFANNVDNIKKSPKVGEWAIKIIDFEKISDVDYTRPNPEDGARYGEVVLYDNSLCGTYEDAEKVVRDVSRRNSPKMERDYITSITYLGPCGTPYNNY